MIQNRSEHFKLILMVGKQGQRLYSFLNNLHTYTLEDLARTNYSRILLYRVGF